MVPDTCAATAKLILIESVFKYSFCSMGPFGAVAAVAVAVAAAYFPLPG